jgi:Fe-S cluster assembly ATP-binding protein
MEPILEIKNLHATVDGQEILRGVTLTIQPGEIHAIMGKNGSGKSTLAKVLAGHPSYVVTEGEVLFKGHNLLELSPDERARQGVFLAFQYPVEIPGVANSSFLRLAYNQLAASRGGEELDPLEFDDLLREKMALVKMDYAFASRSVNQGFSGGEKKRNEILQLALLEPALAILDEIDSGLDIDALRDVADAVNGLQRPDAGFLVVTHYQRLLDYIEPSVVHVFASGQIVRSGGKELAEDLERRGYDWVREAAPVSAQEGHIG